MPKYIAFSLILVLGVLCLTFAVVFAAANAETRQPALRSIQDLSFLKGTWSAKSEGGSYVEEHWSGPVGESIIGQCRFVKDGKTTFYEFMAIVSGPAGITLKMKHFNGAFTAWDEKEEAGDCVLVGGAANEAIFDNNNSEHSVRVTYRRTGAKLLYAAVEDIRDGKTSTYPFEYNLVE